MEPVTTTMAAKAVLTAAAKSAIVRRFTSAIAGVFGDTPKDKERKAQAVRALQDALEGDALGVDYLLARAGIRPNPALTAAAPVSARYPFRKALRDYYIAMGILPDADIRKVIWGSDNDIPAWLRGGSTTPPGTPTPPMSSGGLSPRPVGTSPHGSPVLTAGVQNTMLAALMIGGVALAMMKPKRTRRTR